MKRYVLVAVPLALIALLAACTSPTPTPAPTPTPTATATPTQVPVTASPELGAQLARQMGCTACHSIESNPSVGPAWKGLFGKEETLVGGVRVLVDEAYLRESIVSPNAKVVEGFQPGIMPQDFGTKLSAQQVQAIVDYIKTIQ